MEETKEKTRLFRLTETEIGIIKQLLAEREETTIAINADRGRMFVDILNKFETVKKEK